MRCKLCALLLAALLLFMPVTAYAETVESSDIMLELNDDVSISYDVDSQLYTYFFKDGASFTASEDLSLGPVTTVVLMLFTDDESVDIMLTCDGKPYAYEGDALIDESGEYRITITHTLPDGEQVALDYSVKIITYDEMEESVGNSTETGRIELQMADGGYSASFGDQGKVFCSVADGELSAVPVKLTVGEMLGCTVVRNGSKYAFPSDGLFTEDGMYSVTLTAVYDDGIEIRYLSFAVCTVPSPLLGIYFPPYGYEIDGVLLDGEEYPFGKSVCRFTEDGSYQISYNNGKEHKMTVLTRDTTPPVLYFNGGSELVFEDDVEVSADAPCTITIYKNGENIYNDTVLRGNGIYRITATDDAGNATTARVEITAPSAVNPMLFAFIGAAAIVGIVVYVIREKKKGPVVR